MFLGREEELRLLEGYYAKKGGQLIILYGRRRTGKTELLRYFCKKKEHVFYSCTEVTDEQQLEMFSDRLLRTGMEAGKYIQSFSDWEQAFSNVKGLPFQKKLLVIDEFPYMVQKNNSIPSILQKLWDHDLKNQDVMIILCGSAMSFMEEDILAEKNPLYGRATGILKLLPMSFYEAVQFLPSYRFEEKVEAYAILGGIPHYLKQFANDASLEENICGQILSRGSILYSEVEFLLRQEMRETATYNTIIQAVALGCTKLNEISQKTMIESAKLTSYLKNLISLGIVYKEFSIETGIKESANVQRGLYRLTDHFFRFYYAFVFPNLSVLEGGDERGVWEYVIKPGFSHFVSYAYENICRQYLFRKNKKRELPGFYTNFGRWWNKTDEMDIVGTGADKKHFIAGECKYRGQEMELSDCVHLEEKWERCFGAAERTCYFFSKGGFTDEVRAYAKKTGAVLVGLEEVVEG
ncbi:MAG: ATP-binding protein [Lachnospiraceae bacterium]|nr:ATP-binding protein [Lachnospiraceae bacterium]